MLKTLVLMVALISWMGVSAEVKVIVSSLSPEQEEVALRAHNIARSQVAAGNGTKQPNAKFMLEMKWDKNLAARAQTWANKCIFNYGIDSLDERFATGQNIHVEPSIRAVTPPNIRGAVDAWIEHERLSFSGNESLPIMFNSYTQIVWGKSHLLGCGYALCQKNNEYSKFYVCNYGPAGNVYGQLPYEIGKPSCATYGGTFSKKYRALCDKKITYEVPEAAPTSFSPLKCTPLLTEKGIISMKDHQDCLLYILKTYMDAQRLGKNHLP